MPIHPKQLPPLSPEALAALRPELTAYHNTVEDANGHTVVAINTAHGTFEVDCEIADYIAVALNELLTPAAPAVLECHMAGCTEPEDPNDGSGLCSQHAAELRAELADPANQEEYRQAMTSAMEAEPVGLRALDEIDAEGVTLR